MIGYKLQKNAAGKMKIYLHDEILDILASSENKCMTTHEIANQVNQRGRYHMKNGSDMTAGQISLRTKGYPHLFDTLICLKKESTD